MGPIADESAAEGTCVDGRVHLEFQFSPGFISLATCTCSILQLLQPNVALPAGAPLLNPFKGPSKLPHPSLSLRYFSARQLDPWSKWVGFEENARNQVTQEHVFGTPSCPAVGLRIISCITTWLLPSAHGSFRVFPCRLVKIVESGADEVGCQPEGDTVSIQ